MPGFAEDPQLLTKEKLKRELVAHKVALPAGEHKKEVYVRLYQRHVAPTSGADFSSDEEDEGGAAPSLHGADGGASSSDGVGTTSDMTSKVEVGGLDVDVSSLSNAELARKIREFGVSPGPIVATTRKLYEKKLLRLLEHGDAAPSTAAAGSSGVNGSLQTDNYSDTEDEDEEEEETAEVYEQSGEVTEKSIQTSFRSPFTAHSTKDLKLGGGNDADLFISPSGISATRRRPIRGCARDGWGGFSPDPASRSSCDLGASPVSRPPRQGSVHKAAASGPAAVAVAAASVPVWARLVAFVVACTFIALVYYAFEENVQFSGSFDGAADAATAAAAVGGNDGGGVAMAE